MISGTNDTRYAFVNGIIRVREAKLLKKSHFERLIDAELSSFNVILSDSPYTCDVDFFNTLARVEREERNFFNEYCLHIEARRCLDWPDAIHNLKVKLKHGPEDLLYPVPTNEVESWEEVREILEEHIREKNNFLLSTRLDQILCQKLYENAGFSAFFKRFYELFYYL